MSTGGSIESVAIKGRTFSVAADADVSRDLGGKTAEISPNGDGTVRKLLTRKAWMLEGIVLSIDDARADQEYLEEIAAMHGLVPMSITFASGFTWQGAGSVVGDVKTNSANTTATVNLSGGGKLNAQ